VKGEYENDMMASGLTRRQERLLASLVDEGQRANKRGDYLRANAERAAFDALRQSHDRRVLYQRVLYDGATDADRMTFALDELRSANDCLPPTSDFDGYPTDGDHASACVQRAMGELRLLERS
jgi:hypothetical protein